jgi:hypothetical protein
MRLRTFVVCSASALALLVTSCAATQTCPAVTAPAAEVAPAQGAPPPSAPAPILPSWNDGATRNAIVDFIERVTRDGSPDFVPPEQRIAVFDNDGTLWSEQPVYVQLAFAIDRTRALAPQNPKWKTTQPFKAAIEGDMKTLAAAGTAGLLKLVMATHSGMSSEDFAPLVREWLATARHPKYDRLYTELVYVPMLELLAYLREHGFKTYLVSGGGTEFMRPWASGVYGVPPEQVIGSRVKLAWEQGPDGPVLRRQAEIDFIDDGPGKPIAIQQEIGRRPIFAAGNSDGDQQMLEWSAATHGPSLQLVVHHTDAQREVAYDKDSAVGRLDKALTEAQAKHWVIVDMAADWNKVFAQPVAPAAPEAPATPGAP